MASLPSRPLAPPRTPAATARQRLLPPRVRDDRRRASTGHLEGRSAWGHLAALAAGLVPSLAWAAPDLSPGAVGSPRWLAAALGLGLGAYLAVRQIRRRM